MKLLSIQVGLPRVVGRADATDPMDKPWTTGFFKQPVKGAVWLAQTHLAGDGQADLKHHGGPDKAVNVYPLEHYPNWAKELYIAELSNGAFGENFTTSGLLESTVCIGDIFEIGQALVQVSQPRQPCWKLARRWHIKELARLVQQSGRTGWYFRVLREGEVAADQLFLLRDRPYPEWTIASANEIMYQRKADLEATQKLADCPALSQSWRDTLSRREASVTMASVATRLYGQDDE